MGNTDESMKEILGEFVTESKEHLSSAVDLLERLEDEKKDFEKTISEIGSLVDKIMGAADTLQLTEIGLLTRLAKELSYKSIQLKDNNLYPYVVAVLLDATELTEVMLQTLLDDGKKINLKDINIETFKTRLFWLVDKFKEVSHGSVQINNSQSQEEIDLILKKLGI